nr:ATP-binding cassette domain-containing protein [Microbacterium sp. Se63.02b]
MSELVLDAVTVRRGAGPVISDVSLRVAGGEVLALVGPNGAGKTSLIESVSGVTPIRREPSPSTGSRSTSCPASHGPAAASCTSSRGARSSPR